MDLLVWSPFQETLLKDKGEIYSLNTFPGFFLFKKLFSYRTQEVHVWEYVDALNAKYNHISTEYTRIYRVREEISSIV